MELRWICLEIDIPDIQRLSRIHHYSRLLSISCRLLVVANDPDPPGTNHRLAPLHVQLENGGLGGIKRGARLLEVASDGEISSMDASWSPLAIAVMICGSASTMNGTNDKFEYELVRLIEACRRRGVSVDRGCLTYVSQRFIRPLVLAAYYGFYRSVEALLDAGATPNLVDGEGR
eukprot:CAMPEP_0181022252 /NCGR_PEP_ID=MMETSP1070-20121207/1415_1 /TAXON_ID=265543 /ORGANISM="Minutocellus polymorphus, Strain NH13" /LENGTH=174 /DNA_ID=CAMNT_0023099181 /DNA_START=14 /DNA_END=535 /DNA_ORIENTATION=-